MRLEYQQIRRELETGELVVDPYPAMDAFGITTLDLRLGAIAYDPTGSTTPQTFGFGDGPVLAPLKLLTVATHEYVLLPTDLEMTLYLRPGFARVGMLCVPIRVQPQFRGRISFTIVNFSNRAIQLAVGQRIVTAAFDRLEKPSFPSPTMKHEIALGPDDRLPIPTAPKIDLSSTVQQVIQADDSAKGPALEQLIAELIDMIDGLRVLKRNARSRAEELDIIVQNDVQQGFWRVAGSPLLVECKNSSRPVGAREISILADKMATMGPLIRTAILVALAGVTGRNLRDAQLKLREKRQAGLHILVLGEHDIASLNYAKDLRNLSIGNTRIARDLTTLQE